MAYHDDFSGAGEQIAGPLIGGGVAQVGSLAAKFIWAGKPAAKWGGLIGAALGAAVGGGLMMSRRYRTQGLTALITALLVGLPRQLEDTLRDKGILKDYDGDMGYFGVHTAELGEYGATGPVELIDSGGGMGVQVAETAGAGEVDIMGSYGAGFGSNFMQVG